MSVLYSGALWIHRTDPSDRSHATSQPGLCARVCCGCVTELELVDGGVESLFFAHLSM